MDRAATRQLLMRLSGRRAGVAAAGIALLQIVVLFVVAIAFASADWNEGSAGTGIDGRVRWLLIIPAVFAVAVVLRAAMGHRVALSTLIGAEGFAAIAGWMSVDMTDIARAVVAVPGLIACVLAVVALRRRLATS